MERQQAPWRALLRKERSAKLRQNVRSGQTLSFDQAQTPRVVASASGGGGPVGGRKHGWRRDRDVVRVESLVLFEQDLEEARSGLVLACDEQCEDYPFRCSCGEDPQWWLPVMPSHAFLREGLVHLSLPHEGSRAYCGEDAVPFAVRFYSTDEAQAYGRMLKELEAEVSCFFCLVASWHWAGCDGW